jgi:hypothetical protein
MESFIDKLFINKASKQPTRKLEIASSQRYRCCQRGVFFLTLGEKGRRVVSVRSQEGSHLLNLEPFPFERHKNLWNGLVSDGTGITPIPKPLFLNLLTYCLLYQLTAPDSRSSPDFSRELFD